MDRRAEKLDFEGERVMLETARLAMSDITDVLEVTDTDGVIIFPSETWSDHAKRAVESVKQTETFNKDGDLTSRRIELKMQPKGDGHRHAGRAHVPARATPGRAPRQQLDIFRDSAGSRTEPHEGDRRDLRASEIT